jgi:hypothetical protein
MSRISALGAALLPAIGAMVLTARGVQEATRPDDGPKYVYEVRGGGTQSPTEDRLWSEPFDTLAEAQARLRELVRDHARGGLLESAPNHPVGLRIVKRLRGGTEILETIKEAKEAVDKAKKIAEEGLTAEERKLGDTLNEYANRVRDAWQNAMSARKNLTGMTGNLTQKQFRDVNNLIDSFNNRRADFSKRVNSAGNTLGARYGPVLTRYREVPRVAPEELKGKLGPETAIRPGSYAYSFDNGDGTGVREWRMVLRADGTIQGNLKWRGKTNNVSGIWKLESGRVMVQWKVPGTPKWHDLTDDASKWRRLGD